MFQRFKDFFFTRAFIAFVLLSTVCLSVYFKLNERNTKLSEYDPFIIKEICQFTDKIQHREIPYVLYRPEDMDATKPIQLIVFSHGYGKNYSKNYLGYTYITKFLAAKGFWVLSIQHELQNDPPLPFGENIYAMRLPIWEQGMVSIRTTIEEFKMHHPTLKINSVDLIGHSNGGDMSVLSAIRFPNEFRKIVTLDNLRCPFPLESNPKIMSLRSIDKVADLGVIPSSQLCESSGLEIVQLKKVKHDDMTDYASREQKNRIIAPIYRFLTN